MNGLRIVAVLLSAVIFSAVVVTADSYQSYPAYGYPPTPCSGYGTTAAAEMSCYAPSVSPYCGALPCALPSAPPAPCAPPLPSHPPAPCAPPPTCFRIPCVPVPWCRQDLGGLVSVPCPSRCPAPCAPQPPGPCPVPCASPPFAPPPPPPPSSCSPWPGATTSCFSPATAGYRLFTQPPRRSPGGPRREPVLRSAPKPRRTPRPVPLKLRPYPRSALRPPTSPGRYGYEMTLSALPRSPSAFTRPYDSPPPPSTNGRYE